MNDLKKKFQISNEANNNQFESFIYVKNWVRDEMDYKQTLCDNLNEALQPCISFKL